MAEKAGSYTYGFQRLHVGVFDKEGNKVEKRLLWEDKNGGTIHINITGLNPQTIKMRASNKTVWQKRQGTDEIKSDMDLFNIPMEDLDLVLGREKDENGTSWVGSDTRARYVTIIGESQDGVTGVPVFCALTKGTLGLDSIEFKTTQEKPSEPEPTKLHGEWIERTIDGKSRTVGYHIGKKNSEAFFNLIFDNKELENGEPSNTETTNPVNAASTEANTNGEGTN